MYFMWFNVIFKIKTENKLLKLFFNFEKQTKMRNMQFPLGLQYLDPMAKTGPKLQLFISSAPIFQSI